MFLEYFDVIITRICCFIVILQCIFFSVGMKVHEMVPILHFSTDATSKLTRKKNPRSDSGSIGVQCRPLQQEAVMASMWLVSVYGGARVIEWRNSASGRPSVQSYS